MSSSEDAASPTRVMDVDKKPSSVQRVPSFQAVIDEEEPISKETLTQMNKFIAMMNKLGGGKEYVDIVSRVLAGKSGRFGGYLTSTWKVRKSSSKKNLLSSKETPQ